jgi:hypothetical protein
MARIAFGSWWIGLGTIDCLWKMVQTRIFIVIWTMVQTGPLFLQGFMSEFFDQIGRATLLKLLFQNSEKTVNIVLLNQI